MPHTLHDAIKFAFAFLSYEELPKDERPPRTIWLDSDQMREWWAAVERKREAEGKGEDIEGPVEQNELTRGLRRR